MPLTRNITKIDYYHKKHVHCDYPGINRIGRDDVGSRNIYLALNVKRVDPDNFNNKRYVEKAARILLNFLLENLPYAVFSKFCDLIVEHQSIFADRRETPFPVQGDSLGPGR